MTRIKADKLIGVVAQKDSNVEDPESKRSGKYWNRSKNCKTDKNARWWHHGYHTGQKPFPD